MNTRELGIEQKTIQAGGWKLQCYHAGRGARALMLLHGAGLDSAMLSWKEVMAYFAAHFGDELSVYAIDQPGYGLSTHPGPKPDNDFYPNMIEAVHAAAQALGLEKFALAGLSMGGAVAIGYALKYPAQIEALFPVDSWGLAHKMPCHGFCWWYITHTDWTAAGCRLIARHRSLARWSISSSLIGDKSRITEEMVDDVWEACKAPDAGRAMEDYQRASITKTGCVPEYGARLSLLKMPVLFLNGEKDALVPVKQSRAAAARVPGAKLIVLPGCLHWAPKQMPERFCEEVMAFLRENEKDAAAEK